MHFLIWEAHVCIAEAHGDRGSSLSTWDREGFAEKTASHWLIFVTYWAVIGQETLLFQSF